MAEAQDPVQEPNDDAATHSRGAFDERYLSTTGTIIHRVVHTWPTEQELDPQPGEPFSEAPPPSLDRLAFVPQPMVGWYRPSELVRAGIRAAISSTFGSYADKREVESVLTEAEWYDYSEHLDTHGELWIDYVADLGDGWDATYTIARLLAEDKLGFDDEGRCLDDPDQDDDPTRRGHVLIMGGDQVYPTATREEYENRLIQPYRHAFPFAQYSALAPHLYLIPGNHDWYDGLNSFFKLFCQQGWVGGWKTQQRRSYFALKLVAEDKASNRPDVWLWGIDLQLSSNIDRPQLEYFKHIASDEVMKPGAKIILCSAEPSWVYVDAKTREKKGRKKEKAKEEIYHNLGHLEKWAIRPKETGHEVIVALAGDWHNYTRYGAKDGSQQQRFVSGGGGAYLYPTHNMPCDLKLPEKFGGAEYRREATFPSEAKSKKLARRSLRLPFFRLNWYFTGFLGAFYLLLAWVVQSVSKIGDGVGHTLLDKFAEGFDLGAFIEIIAHSPESVVFLLVLVAGLVAFSGYETWWKKILHGGLHGLVHVALFLGLICGIAQLNLNTLGLGVNSFWQVLLFGVLMLLFGGFLGGSFFGIYLWFSNRFLGIHDNEVLLCQSHPDYKHFLRFHIKKDGTLTVYPIGVERVNRKRSWKRDKTRRTLAAWALQTDAEDGAAWFEPKEGAIQEFARLIEEDPITISYAGSQATTPPPPEASSP